MRRRTALALPVAGALAGCGLPEPAITGAWVGASHARGHLLRQPPPGWDSAAPADTRRVHTLIAGGGVAGLAAARALRQRGIDDFALLELEDAPGGNSRGGQLQGLACPLGAHYLPVPGPAATEVLDLLEELGLRQRVAGRWVLDERHLCHSPQERVYFNGHWQDGLLPVHGVAPATLAQYQRLEALITRERQQARYTIPLVRAPLLPAQRALDAQRFAPWLAQHGITDPVLLGYLDYCCRDDYGAGIDTVSAWAGVHYFASRHGFAAPGSAAREREAVLTWPEGNGWLTRRLAAPLGERLHTGRVVLRVGVQRHGVQVDAWNTTTARAERWQASHCILALPLLAAARVLQPAPPALAAAAASLPTAAWLVANLHLRGPLPTGSGPALAWDNVLHQPAGSNAGLGYVNAGHQSLHPAPGATVLTHYRALGTSVQARRQLYSLPWTHWRDTVLAELALPHPGLASLVTRIECMRYGHAMAVPVPGQRTHPALAALQTPRQPPGFERLQFAHSDLSGYSVFEEAFTHGHRAGQAV